MDLKAKVIRKNIGKLEVNISGKERSVLELPFFMERVSSSCIILDMHQWKADQLFFWNVRVTFLASLNLRCPLWNGTNHFPNHLLQAAAIPCVTLSFVYESPADLFLMCYSPSAPSSAVLLGFTFGPSAFPEEFVLCIPFGAFLCWMPQSRVQGPRPQAPHPASQSLLHVQPGRGLQTGTRPS